MSGRLKPRRARGSAFATDRTDLSDVTTPAPSAPPLGELMPKVTTDPPQAGSTASPTETKEAERLARRTGTERPRGAGGRPAARPGEGPRGVSKRPARIPADLYQRAEPLVKGPGKPSWGQLIYWACTTHREEVVAATVEWAKPSDPLAPRGANRAGGVTTPIIPQFLGEEIVPVDAVKDDAAERAMQESAPAGRAKVTATAVVIAALSVAVENTP